MTSRTITVAVVALGLLAAGCGDDGGMPDGGGTDAGSEDAGTDTGPPPGDAGACPSRDEGDCISAPPIDMLWVVDNSNSMAEEQASLAFNFPRLIELLTNPPDDDDDGRPDFMPLGDIRMGVVTSDLGVGDNPGVIGCPSATGDEGRMVSASRSGDAECSGVDIGSPPWLQYTGEEDTTGLENDFACLAKLGTDGCGLEQQLESSYKALFELTDSGDPHEGFLRSNSLVVIVYVTDEDDCSAADEAIFDPSPAAREDLGPTGTRCAMHPELLHPVDRYVDAFKGLNLDREGGVIVAAITGTPRDFTEDPKCVDYDELLSSDEMQIRTDPEDDNHLAPACELGGAGSAAPARRIVQVVREFAETGNGVTLSICEPDLRPAIETIAEIIGDKICPPPI